MKQLTLIALFVLLATQSAKAQTEFFEPLPDASTGLDNPEQWFYRPLTLATREGKNILVVMGYFGEVPGLSGSENIFYIENGTEKAFPFPVTVPVFDATNDADGNLYIGTENGLMKETDQGWQTVFNTEGFIVKIVKFSPERNRLIFSAEDHDWLDKAHTTMYYTSGDTAIEFYDILAVAIGYAEFQGKGFCGFGIEPGSGADTDDYSYIVNLETMTEETEFQEPEISFFSYSGIGYIVVANAELWIQSGWEYETFVYRDDTWIATGLGLGPLSVVDDEPYWYSYKVEVDFSLSETLVTETEHATAGYVQKFNNIWYFASRQVTWLFVGPLSLPIEEFWGSDQTTCLYSGLARISITTGIDDQLSEEISVYPNPANGMISIKGQSVNFYNQFGQLILTENLYDETSTIDVSDWHSGLYYYSLSKHSGEKESGTIIVY